jgi:class 3 adenylate cyclase/cold shock CspA family protein
MKLFENIRDPNLRVGKTIMFVDIVDSTGMKEREAEASWLVTFGCVYDVIREVVEEGEHGVLVKYTGDGALVVYGNDYTADAINDAIRIQESIKEDVEKRTVTVSCSIGIGSGVVVEFETSHGVDYLGTIVDRAARLCSIASAGAIFVDTATTASAQMTKVHAKVGDVLGRTTDEYQGPVERANVPGFAKPVEYHEIKWDLELRGVKSKAVTAAAESLTPALPLKKTPTVSNGSAIDRSPSDRRGIRGTVRMWDKEKGRGPIIGADGQEFYCDARFIVSQDGLERDDIVYFVPQPTSEPGRHPIATATVYMGQEVDAIVTNVLDKGFGFLQVLDQRDNPQDIFFALSEAPEGIQRGEAVTCQIFETARGPRAEGLERRTPAAKAA